MSSPKLDDARLQLAEFGEASVYRKKSGAERSIRVIVERTPPERVPESPQPLMGWKIRAFAVNCATDGIAGAEVDRGGDELKIAIIFGQSPVFRPIRDVPNSDGGMLELEIG